MPLQNGAKLQFVWNARVGLDNQEVGICLPSGWVNEILVTQEYPSFAQLLRDFPKMFDFVPYKNIGGNELNIPFYRHRVDNFVVELTRIASGKHYEQMEFHNYGILTTQNPGTLGPGLVCEIELADDGLSSYGVDTTRKFDIQLAAQSYVVDTWTAKTLSPGLLKNIVAKFQEQLPQWLATQWGMFSVLYQVVAFIEAIDFSTKVDAKLIIKYSDMEYALTLTEV